MDGASEGGSASGGTPESLPGCRRPRKAPRTFVGFSDDMSFEDFELAAYEAERILSLVGAELCMITEAEDSAGSLRAALGAGARVEIIAVHFTHKDAGAADVHVRLLSDGGSGAGAGTVAQWLLRLDRQEDAWRIESVDRP
jgi:hypothetical protein